ncbi:MAG: tetratricopeptide repeat protein [Gemmatimonadetes bacterium]|nr:tetratricopeptide repeat protein [Gemmatimonadota bacterium]
MTGYTTHEVSEVLGLPTSTILSWTRAGLLTPARGPRGAYYFSFTDVAVLRSARELLRADVPARRVRQTLEKLREQLPNGRALSAVHLSASGSRILVRDEGRVWDPGSGQMLMDLEAAEGGPEPSAAAPSAEPLAPAPAPDAPPSPTAEEWYDAGVDLEGSDPRRAREAYGRALELDPRHAEAHLNLGRLLHEAGDLDKAEAHYRAALEADPGSARASFNLGVVLEDRGREADALEAYELALRLDPELGVAHFNASRLCEARGRETEALGHLAAYRRILSEVPPGA